MQVFNKTNNLVVSACLEYFFECYYQHVLVTGNNTVFSEEIKVVPNSGEYLIYNSVSLLCSTVDQECNYAGVTIEIKTSECYNTEGLAVQLSGHQSLFFTCLVPMEDGSYRQNMLANAPDNSDYLSFCKVVPVISSANNSLLMHPIISACLALFIMKAIVALSYWMN
jgi:hypothetical protein